MTSTRSLSSNIRTRSVTRRIESFRQRFGDGHFYLACHAALPLALTPDLLYSLWANFQQDTHGEAIEIPWIAVADLMLSNLCKEVGHELYEMDGAVRDELLQQLQQDDRFGLERVRELADFVMAYIEQQLDSPDLDIRDLATSQQWRALAYKNPSEAAYHVAAVLAQLPLNDKAEWIRMAALISSLAEPLSAFQPLLNYVRAMADLARGNVEAATTQMAKAVDANNQVRVEGVSLPIPDAIHGELPQSTEQDTPAISLPNWFVKPIAIAGGIVISLLIVIAWLSQPIRFNSQSTPISSATPTPQTSSSATPTPQASSSPSPTSSPSPSPKPPQASSVIPQKPVASQPQSTSSSTSSPTIDSSVASSNSNSRSSAIPPNSSIELLPNSTQSTTPQPSTSPSSSLLQRGDSGPEVEALQAQLSRLGYFDGPFTGHYGDLTEEAVRRFQRDNGMSADGNYGPATAAALRSYVEFPGSVSTPSPNPSKNTPSQPSTVSVAKVDVTGSTVFSERDLQVITRRLEGKLATLEELRGVADAITQLYTNNGYVTSRAFLPDQTLTNGVVVIQVVEGSLERIDVEGTQTVNPDDIRQIVQRGVSVPLNQNNLRAQLELLQTDPRFTNVQASLNPGTKLGQSILVIQVTEADRSLGKPAGRKRGGVSR